MLINMPTDELYQIKHSCDEHPMQSEFSMHAHSHYELLIFISGDITYTVEGNFYRPKPYDILLFDIAETHRVIVHSDVSYERLVIQMDKKLFFDIGISKDIFAPFVNRKPGENNILHETDFRDDMWKKCILRLAQSKALDKIDVSTLLLSLLNEIRHAYPHREVSRKQTPLTLRILLYINDHITEDLSPEKLAQRFFISRSFLYSMFRDATGTGIHNYINVKRLIMAQDLISEGEPATEVCKTCGFKDYSTFYRAYKGLFGKSPKETGKSKSY